ncbi:methylated-DNA--[protein]-cysteine S-methyltransferase [Arenimonas daejeonensis]|uniref:methylated-DNA--[protein]-cysteine S-methyltransferase n=1 Tax=Arenimonas daejeonensis TaxID=370777 RepID=UPI0011BF056A|nr:methylated-DNA--[protein]-cysteine S-methyltransferase [Arenimonas daejeonensis]
MWFDEFDTPIGVMTMAADPTGLRHVLFPDNKYPPARDTSWRRDAGALREAREQLLAYFAGERQTFDLPLAPTGTAFQVKVWTTLARIPYGRTWSYGDLARHIGEPKAVRAVGAANGRNPLPVILPCHRVIGADGSLTGFGGGLPLKKFLLQHEGRHTPLTLA